MRNEPQAPGPMRPVSRRDALCRLGAVVAAVPLSSLLGCDGEDGSAAHDAGAGDGDDGSPGYDAGSGTDAGTGAVDSGTQASDGGVVGWASGGTIAMTGIADYPDPFAEIPDPACTPTCTMTEGPCHDDQAPEREDISEGQTGLPVRFGLRIVDAECEPVTDANVDIWHCDVAGVYSSETADNPPFCTGDNATALASRWFRGHRQTDAKGVAWFNTCFPGWYSGRAVHIHVTVRRSSRDGDEYATSQVAFPNSLIAELFASHPDYAQYGQPDTANDSDSVFPSATVDDYVVETQRMADGALLAWMTIIIRSSLDDSVCSASGSGGGMPPP